jgi:plastocyanin
MSEGEQRRRRVRNKGKGEPPERLVQIDLVAGPNGVEFRPAAMRIPAGTTCLWRNQSGHTQEVLPVGDGPPFKGGPLPPGGERLVLARHPATFALRLASNPAALVEVVVTEEASSPRT